MKKDNNVCIRVDRDGEQIERCKTKMEEIDTSASDFAKILSLAGNEVRMKILLLLQAEERLCVCDLSEILGMKIPAVSQHLRKLKDGDLVQTERAGTTIFYSLTEEAKPILQVLFRFIAVEVV